MDIDFDAPLDYLPRIKNYYIGLGYGKPYEWAKLDDVPFANLQKPIWRRVLALSLQHHFSIRKMASRGQVHPIMERPNFSPAMPNLSPPFPM